ncbi:MAG: 30S ribosomal protein S16 [Candidatus Colwellbacteria bacterium]|nr:30S ribosomal protein S16 [Candidatus Colwellbacteria bacterium]
MLKIRLQRIGKKGQAYFRIVATEHTRKPKGRFVEDLGSYDPHKNIVNAKKERVEYWISKGAGLSPTVNNLLVGRDIIKGEKVQVWKAKSRSRTETEGKKKDNGKDQIKSLAPTTAPVA